MKPHDEKAVSALVAEVLARHQASLAKASKTQLESVKKTLTDLFAWQAPDGFTVPPLLVHIMPTRGELGVVLHWRVWARIAHSAGWRWSLGWITDQAGTRIGRTISLWHKDDPEAKYSYDLIFSDYSEKISRWKGTDLMVMVDKTLLKNALAFYAPDLVTSAPFTFVETYDDADAPAPTSATAPVPAPAPQPVLAASESTPDALALLADDSFFRKKVAGLIKYYNIPAQAVKEQLPQAWGVEKLEAIPAEKREEFLVWLTDFCKTHFPPA